MSEPNEPITPVVQYHQATLTMLEWQPVVTRAAEAEIAKAERESGWVLPPSVREWYLFDLDASARGGVVRYPPRRGELLNSLRRAERTGFYANLLALTGDGGDGTWYVRLDGGNDPPVVEENDPRYGDSDLHPVSPRFSEWLFMGLFPVLGVYLTACSTDRSWEPIALDYLQDHLEHSRTVDTDRGPGHYFYGRGCWVCVMPAFPQFGGGVAAQWWVTARYSDDLAALLRGVWPFGGFAAGVGGFGTAADHVVALLSQEVGPPR
jgi:hypothetical protein